MSNWIKHITIFSDFLKISVLIIKKTEKNLKNCDFQKSERNSKKFPKNVKFGLQAHFNMENMLKGSD